MNTAKAVVMAMDFRSPEQWSSLGLATQHLAPVANKPVLFHHLEELSAAGIAQTAILCDRRSHGAVREAVRDGSAWDLEVRYVEVSPHERALMSSAVAGFIGSAPVLIQHGDILLHESLTSLQAQFAHDGLDALVMHAGRWSSEAPSLPRAIDGYFFGAGVYADVRRSAAPLGDALDELRAAGARIEERNVEACLPCRGGSESLLATNLRLLEAMPAGPQGERIFNSRLQGRVTVDPSAEIHDSIIRGPVAIGPGARITNAYIGPYTSIGPGAVIDCAEIENSIVLDKAQIRCVSPRIESSIIGPRAQVTRDFELPRAVRLSLGAGAHVAVA